jgi:hypothetical protein
MGIEKEFLAFVRTNQDYDATKAIQYLATCGLTKYPKKSRSYSRFYRNIQGSRTWHFWGLPTVIYFGSRTCAEANQCGFKRSCRAYSTFS